MDLSAIGEVSPSRGLSLSLALMAAFSDASASAADVAEDLVISATVNNECSLIVGPLGGAAYNALNLGAQGYSSGALMLKCNAGKDLAVGVEIGETKKSTVAPRQGGARVTFPVLTQNARSFVLIGSAVRHVTVATTSTEQAVVGYDGALYLEHPESGMAVEVSGVCKAVLPSPLPSIEVVVEARCD